jgi:excisionase family DNA binding protein
MRHLSEDRLVTKKQAAERLAVSTRTIDRMVAMRRLDKIFVGPSPRFRKKRPRPNCRTGHLKALLAADRLIIETAFVKGGFFCLAERQISPK